MTHTIPHYIKSNAKNYPKDIARDKKIWCLEN